MNDESGQMIAKITYKEEDNQVWNADHTFVDPALRGQGIALKLVDSLVELAVKEGKKILPTCPYVVRVFNENQNKYAHVHAK